jgi:hypothetical protein
MFKHRFPITLAGPLVAVMALAACVGSPEPRRGAGPAKKPPAKVQKLGYADDRATRQCLSDLGAASVEYTPLPDTLFGGGCTALGSVKLLDIGTPVTNLGAMTCPLAKTFAAWARNGVAPAARKILRAEVVKIETMGTYACRNIVGRGGSSAKLSEHAHSNAVDVAAFILDDGRRIAIRGGWNGGTEDERAFLRTIHSSACKRFATVLSPDYNSAHYDHLHFDMGKGPFCR